MESDMSKIESVYQIAPVSFRCPAERDDGPEDHPLEWYTVADTHFDFAEWLNDLDLQVDEICSLCKELKIKSSDDFWLRILNVKEFNAWCKYRALAKMVIKDHVTKTRKTKGEP
jgi:hypothetical protein